MALASRSPSDALARDDPRERDLYGEELSLATATLDELEQATRAIDAEWVERRWSADREIEELAVLRTCHRIEVLQIRRGDPASLPPGPAGGWRRRRGAEALAHLYRVTAGLESLARGEREVRAQVQVALRRSRSRLPRPILGELFREMLQAVETIPPLPAGSVAAIAAARLLREVAVPFPRVLIVGSGVVGRQVAEALGPHARTTIVYRRTPPPEPFLRSCGARAVPIGELSEELPLCDGLVAAAKVGERIVAPADLVGRPRPLALIDLGVPRNIDPNCRAVPGVRLVDLGTLYQGRALPTEGGPEDAGIRARADQGARRLEQLLAEPRLDALMRDAEALRRREIERALPYLGELTGEQRAALDHLSQRLVRRLLAAPLGRVRGMPPGPARDRALAAFAELVRSDARP